MGIGAWVSKALAALDPERMEAALEATLQKLRADRKTRSVLLKELVSAYTQEKLVLVLGAGVSQEYGLPSWSALLQELLMRSLSQGLNDDPEQSAALAEVYTQVVKPNPLIAARYIRLNLRDTFVETVREILYSRIKAGDESELIREIRNLATAPGKAPNLDSIITFNFDDVLEQSLKRIDIEVPFHVITDMEIKAKTGFLPIYHVHGYLPREGKAYADAKLILSEDDYHSRYSDIYHWSNIIQINKFRENNCLFIGMSFSDPNLRRLLDIAQKQRGDNQLQHFLIRKRYSADEVLASLSALRAEANTSAPGGGGGDENAPRRLAEKVVNLMETMDEKDALSFGVSIFWIADFTDIPKLLNDIYRQLDHPSFTSPESSVPGFLL